MFKRITDQVGSASTGLLGMLFIVSIFCAAVYGYIENIVKLLALDGHANEHVLQIIIRVIGVLTSLGAVIGYF